MDANNTKTKRKSHHAGHRQRVIQKYVNHGLDTFSEHEVLEMILYFSIPRRDTNELAHIILNEFGSLENVFNASPEELEKIDGVGKHSAVLLTMFRTVHEYKNTQLYDKRIYFKNIGDIGLFCVKYFSEHVNESSVLLSLDAKCQLKKVTVISKGTVNETAFYPSKIIKSAINTDAAAIVIAHNHPGGTLQPSSADITLTRKLVELCSAVNIELMDHIICNEIFFTSLRERGLLEPNVVID